MSTSEHSPSAEEDDDNLQRGHSYCNTDGYLDGYGPLWCHPDVIAIIVSFSNVEKKVRGTVVSR